MSERRKYQRVREQQQAEGHFTRGVLVAAWCDRHLGTRDKSRWRSIFALRKPAALRKKRSTAWSTGP
jgi:hypothetical protein